MIPLHFQLLCYNDGLIILYITYGQRNGSKKRGEETKEGKTKEVKDRAAAQRAAALVTFSPSCHIVQVKDTMESIDIKTTIEQYLNGDVEAFSKLYHHLVDRVFAYVVTRVNDRDTATEVTEDVFVELYRALPRCTYYSDPSFYAFVFTIVRRQLIGRYQQNKKHDAVPINEEIYSHSSNGGVTEETKISVQQALETLDELNREIVVLHHWSRFTFAEIGMLINMTEGAVRVRHHRAQSALAKALQT